LIEFISGRLLKHKATIKPALNRLHCQPARPSANPGFERFGGGKSKKLFEPTQLAGAKGPNEPSGEFFLRRRRISQNRRICWKPGAFLATFLATKK
jgi:hypothetical protein